MSKRNLLIQYERHTRSLIYLMICLTLALFPVRVVFAAGNQLFISPSTSQMNVGTSFTVNVKSYSDTDESTGSASGSIIYPTSKLKIVSISTAGSSYDVPCSGKTSSPYISQSPGTIGFCGQRSPAGGGIDQIFNIKFKAIGGGTATVSFQSTSKVNGASTSYTHGVFTIVGATKPSSQPSHSPSPSSTVVPVTSTPDKTNDNTSDNTPQPSPDESGLIDNTSVLIEPLYDSATISWKTTKTATSMALKYGLDGSNLNNTANVTKNKDGSYSTKITGLEPGKTYFFTITGKDKKKNTGTYSDAIYPRGFPVTFIITENGQPAKNAFVTIGEISRNADQDGKLTLGLAAGDYSGKISTDTADPLTISLTVTKKSVPSDGSDPESQSFTYDLKSSPLEQGPGTGFSVLSFIGILLAGTLVLGIGFFGYITYRRRHFESEETVIRRGPSVIIDDGYDWTNQRPVQKKRPPPEGYEIPSDIQDGSPPDGHSLTNEPEPKDMFDQVDTTETSKESADQSNLNSENDSYKSEETDETYENDEDVGNTDNTDDGLSISHGDSDETQRNSN